MISAESIYEDKQQDGTIKYFLRTRKFLGKTEDFNDKEEQKFEKKHLKAYLKGQQIFNAKVEVKNPEAKENDPKQYIYKHKVQEGLHLVPITEEEAHEYKNRKAKQRLALVEQ